MLLSGLLLGGVTAEARDTLFGVSTNELTVGAPLEVDVVGLAAGVHPEVLWRPLEEGSGLRLRASSALKFGSEFTLLAPLSLGLRWQTSSQRLVQAQFGTGFQWKMFLVPDSGAHQRIDWYWELGVNARVAPKQRLGLTIVPEFGLANITAEGLSGTFGLGLAARVGWSMALE